MALVRPQVDQLKCAKLNTYVGIETAVTWWIEPILKSRTTKGKERKINKKINKINEISANREYVI